MDKLRFDQVDKCWVLKFHSCQKSVGKLFLGFLHYFSTLDTNKNCLTMSERVDRMDDRMEFTRNVKSQFQPLIVQDPFTLRNAAWSVNTRRRLQNVLAKFTRSHALATAGGHQITLTEICATESNEEENCEDGGFDFQSLQVEVMKLD